MNLFGDYRPIQVRRKEAAQRKATQREEQLWREQEREKSRLAKEEKRLAREARLTAKAMPPVNLPVDPEPVAVQRIIGPKSIEQLEAQVTVVQNSYIGNEPDQTLMPPSRDRADILQLSLPQLRQRFKRRYEMYARLLLDEHRVNHDTATPENLVSEAELDRMRHWLQMMNRLDAHIAREHTGEDPTLRVDQLDVFEKIRQFFETGDTEGFIVLPTGSGKTVIASELAEAFDVPTLFVVPTLELLDQTKDKFQQFASDLTVGTVNGKTKELGQQVTVITYASLVSMVESGRLDPEQFNLLILDEVHGGLTERRMAVIKRFTGALKLGMTATDEYAEDKTVAGLLGHEIARVKIRESIERGALADTRCAIVRTNIDLSDVEIRDGVYDPMQLEKKYNIAGLTQSAIDLYQTQHRGERAVVFCAGVQHAKDVAATFCAAGIRAAAVYGDMSPAQRADLVAAFRAGKFDILTNAKVLREGFDVPEVSVILNIAPNGSVVDATQGGGRGTRLDPKNPNKLSSVYDFLPIKDSRRPLITFAQILGDAYVARKHAPGNTTTKVNAPSSRFKSAFALPVITGVEVIYDVEEVMTVTKEYGEVRKQITAEDIQAALVADNITAIDWLPLTERKRSKIKLIAHGKELGLAAIARIFGIEGSPIGYFDIFVVLCRSLFGDVAVDEAQSTLLREKEAYQQQQQAEIRRIFQANNTTALDWLLLKRREKSVLKITIYNKDIGLIGIASIFGIEGDPVSHPHIFITLCRAIFGDVAVEAARQVLLEQQQAEIRTVLQQTNTTLLDWLRLGSVKREKIKLELEEKEIGLNAIARIFDIQEKIASEQIFITLCRAIFGDVAVDEAQHALFQEEKSNRHQQQAEIRTVLQQTNTTVRDWLLYGAIDRPKIKLIIQGKEIGLNAIARIFGIERSPILEDIFITLCRAIFGDTEVDTALATLPKRRGSRIGH